MNAGYSSTRNVAGALAEVCRDSCHKLAARVEKIKRAIIAEFHDPLSEPLLRLALNEAEALAWQTEFPHLVFPALATEKAQAVVVWSNRQRSIQRTNSR